MLKKYIINIINEWHLERLRTRVRGLRKDLLQAQADRGLPLDETMHVPLSARINIFPRDNSELIEFYEREIEAINEFLSTHKNKG